MQEHRRDQEAMASVAIMVTSDTRTIETDESGKKAVELFEKEGHKVVAHIIVKNDTERIRSTFESFTANTNIQVIITSGGTGVGLKDITVDTVAACFDKKLEGFGELFRRLSYDEIGIAAVMSRATAGISKGKLVFCLPGSKGAMVTALQKIILPSLGHTLWELNRK
jgi:molybdenum cofactor biosynthesis protein B